MIEDLYGHWALRWLTDLGWLPSLPWGVLMWLVSVGVTRRKRMAWRVTVLIFALMFAADVLVIMAGAHHIGSVAAAVAYGLGLAALVGAREEFAALPDRSNRRFAVTVFGVLLVANGLVGTAIVALTDSHKGGPWYGEPVYVLLQTVLGVGVTGHALGVTVPAWVDVLLGVLGTALLLLTAWASFRPDRARSALAPREELRVRALLAEYGEQDSLGYFALRRDKDVVFAPNGKAAIVYRAEGSVCLVSGDPLGEAESWSAAICGWLELCRAHAWTPAVMSAGEAGATAFKRHGLDALELGDEAIVDLRDFNLDGRNMRQVRQAVRRVERAGYTLRVRRHSQISPEEMERLIALAESWRDGASERGFSMALGRLGDPIDGRCVMVEAIDRTGRVRGLLSFVPWGRTGLSLDLMRRDREAENGLNEYMVAGLGRSAAALGVQRMSLNFAVLRDVFERGSSIGAGPIVRLVYRLLLLASKFWQLESLYVANAKYRPEWVSRYICFPQSGDIVRIGLAAARAEGFLPTLRRPAPVVSHAPPGLIAQLKVVEERIEAGRVPERRLSEQERVRHAKLAQLRDCGIDPYPVGDGHAGFVADVLTRHGGIGRDVCTGETVTLAGRVLAERDHGGLVFARVRDETGDIQVMLARDAVGVARLAAWKRFIDLGDLVEVRGEVVTSRHGELSVLVGTWELAAKCLRPLPARLADPEARVRRRHVDLIVNDAGREMLRRRAEVTASLRDGLRGRGFLEVETPMLQAVHGGATARPFVTHMNAYNMPLYLRIAPELYLKRLLVGGAGKVFELNRNFRNEGVSPRHNPEFTMLEAYEPYGNYDTMAVLVRELIVAAARAALGTTVLRRDGEAYDLAGAWPSVTVHGAVSDALGDEVGTDTGLVVLHKHADRVGMAYDTEWSPGRLVQEMFEYLVEPTLRFPTFVRDYPADTSPLTRPHRDNPELAEKWDLIAFGIEVATAYSELTDPVEQRRRLTEQSLLAAGGDVEAMRLDEDFLGALEHGMPPSGGLGMGVDRLLIMFTGQTIRDTVAFPLSRPN